MQMQGKKLGGRYEILGRIGGGGMAVVYKAIDSLLNRHVAIKVLNESLSNNSEFIRRFDREAQAAASLSHPNVVNVYDVGRDGYTHYIVMELVDGPTLKQHILDNGPLPVDEAVHIAVQICDGLSHAHENKIVHRDIKPHNILIGSNGRVKVTDFGIARAATSSTITQTGSVMGSVHYFSPEQARGGVVGEKSDIYSLGIVLYEMLTGELPFDGDSAISIALKHLQEKVVDPRELNPDIPENIVRIVMRALEKDPEMRYTSAKAMMQDLNYAVSLDRGLAPNWPRRQPAQEYQDYQTIPLHLDDDDSDQEPDVNSTSSPVASESGDPYLSPIQRPEIRNNHRDNRPTNREIEREPRTAVMGEETMMNLERLRGMSNDKDKTLIQRTVVYLENLQEKLPWWQKLLFGLLTFAVILGLAIWGLASLWSLISHTGSKESNNTQQQTQEVVMKDLQSMNVDEAKKWLTSKGFQNIEVRYKKKQGYEANTVIDQEPAPNEQVTTQTPVVLTVNVGETEGSGQLKVKNFIGMWQSEAEKYTNGSLGYRVDINNSRCYPGNLPHGKILDQYPAPGKPIEKNGVVYLWISVPGNSNCKAVPPSLGGSVEQ